MKDFFLAKALGMTEEEMEAAQTRADRLAESFKPDGRREYVPLTKEYADKNLVSRTTLRRLENGE